MKKKSLLYTGLGIFGALVTFGVYFTERVIHISKKDENEIIERDGKLGHIKPLEWNTLPKREVSIPSPHGYSISAMVIKPHPTNKFIVFSHGVTESKMSSVKYANLFLNRGFNAVIYDQRRHGNTGGKTTSYGYYEKDDLRAVVDWLYKDQGDIYLGIHGESMGAVTTLLYAAEEKAKANFYIVDCPFSDLKELLKYRMKEEVKYLPPSIFVPIGSLFLKIRDHYWMEDVSPIKIIDKIKEPILFIHSQKDDYILPYMTQDLYDRKKGPKMLFMAPNGTHAQSLNENREDYEKAIDDFLEKYIFPNYLTTV